MAGCVRPQHRLLLVLMMPTALCAQGAAALSQDPTRPAYAAASSSGASELAPVSRLNSIVLPKSSGGSKGGARPYAVIDGVVVYVGDSVGDARVQQIKEGTVVLKSASGTETLLLTPSAEKKFTQQNNAIKRSVKVVPSTRDPS